jgi:hypothetical protein
MLTSNRVLNAILDHMLQLLPDEPADSKRLDDIVDADAANAEFQGSGMAGAGAQPRSVASRMRAAS